MVSSVRRGPDGKSQGIEHVAVNACLAPLCSVDSCHVTTVEGIGNSRSGVHMVQQRLAELHGSQCGFCTPGIVMSLYAMLRRNPNPTLHDIEHGFDGNLCRCTVRCCLVAEGVCWLPPACSVANWTPTVTVNARLAHAPHTALPPSLLIATHIR